MLVCSLQRLSYVLLRSIQQLPCYCHGKGWQNMEDGDKNHRFSEHLSDSLEDYGYCVVGDEPDECVCLFFQFVDTRMQTHIADIKVLEAAPP